MPDAESKDPAIVVKGLKKYFGDVHALDGIDLVAERGTVTGVLGPNGAGKTTVVRILATLLKADSGSASVLDLDVNDDATKLRTQIGLAGQYAAVDENLTGTENLTIFGRLYGMSRSDAKDRAAELLLRFKLDEAADRIVKTYSGGMRRRLDLAAALVAQPPVLFLDEPTTGLDPRSRIDLWETIEDLVEDGTTVLLTTQYLDEADRLADRIVVIDRGKVIAEGTAAELKDEVGGLKVEVHVSTASDPAEAAKALAEMSEEEPEVDGHLVRIRVPREDGTIMEAVRKLDAAGVNADDIAVREPTLDDVFLSLTGQEIPPEDGNEQEGQTDDDKEANS